MLSQSRRPRERSPHFSLAAGRFLRGDRKKYCENVERKSLRTDFSERFGHRLVLRSGYLRAKQWTRERLFRSMSLWNIFPQNVRGKMAAGRGEKWRVAHVPNLAPARAWGRGLRKRWRLEGGRESLDQKKKTKILTNRKTHKRKRKRRKTGRTRKVHQMRMSW